MIPAPSPMATARAQVRALRLMAVLSRNPPRGPFTIPDDLIGQELLDRGWVARTCHAAGGVTYRLTAAGKRWRAG